MITNGDNGVIVECRNSNELATAMARLLTDRESAKKMGTNAKKIYTRVDKNLVCNRWLDLIRDCRGRKNGV